MFLPSPFCQHLALCRPPGQALVEVEGRPHHGVEVLVLHGAVVARLAVGPDAVLGGGGVATVGRGRCQ